MGALITSICARSSQAVLANSIILIIIIEVSAHWYSHSVILLLSAMMKGGFFVQMDLETVGFKHLPNPWRMQEIKKVGCHIQKLSLNLPKESS